MRKRILSVLLLLSLLLPLSISKAEINTVSELVQSAVNITYPKHKQVNVAYNYIASWEDVGADNYLVSLRDLAKNQLIITNISNRKDTNLQISTALTLFTPNTNYRFAVGAVFGEKTYWKTVEYTTTIAPVITEPKMNDQTAAYTKVDMKWLPTKGATLYKLSVRDLDQDKPLVDAKPLGNVTSLNSSQHVTLSPGTNYRFAICAMVGSGSYWSTVQFKTVSAPKVSYPASDAKDIPYTGFNVTWDKLNEAKEYRISIRNLKNNSVILAETVMENQRYIDERLLDANTQYRLYVAAVLPNGILCENAKPYPVFTTAQDPNAIEEQPDDITPSDLKDGIYSIESMLYNRFISVENYMDVDGTNVSGASSAENALSKFYLKNQIDGSVLLYPMSSGAGTTRLLTVNNANVEICMPKFENVGQKYMLKLESDGSYAILTMNQKYLSMESSGNVYTSNNAHHWMIEKVDGLSEQIGEVVTASTTLNVRAGPDTAAPVVARAKSRDYVTIFDDVIQNSGSNWYYIRLLDSTNGLKISYGYASADYIQTVGMESVDSMILSQDGIDFVCGYEGYIQYPYDDGYGYMTVGFGHLIKKGENFSAGLSREEAKALFVSDIKGYADAVNKFASANGIVLLQNQFDALVSYTYNLGTGVWNNSGNYVRNLLIYKRENYTEEEIGEAFTKYIYSGGKLSTGLWRRRMDEVDIFVNAEYNREYRTYPN